MKSYQNWIGLCLIGGLSCLLLFLRPVQEDISDGEHTWKWKTFAHPLGSVTVFQQDEKPRQILQNHVTSKPLDMKALKTNNQTLFHTLHASDVTIWRLPSKKKPLTLTQSSISLPTSLKGMQVASFLPGESFTLLERKKEEDEWIRISHDSEKVETFRLKDIESSFFEQLIPVGAREEVANFHVTLRDHSFNLSVLEPNQLPLWFDITFSYQNEEEYHFTAWWNWDKGTGVELKGEAYGKKKGETIARLIHTY
ncbi:hypothetical protein ACFYKX_11035 [Cytobacillus sp. FJAT-54145]|uniref:Uncharacterized protein n=1 Tax=Cytobacillus spartinae TaxID=3299023 RepID=A0ABW6KA85_9BACI